MGYIVSWIYIVYYHLSLPDLFPSLMSLRIGMVLLGLAGLVTLFSFISQRVMADYKTQVLFLLIFTGFIMFTRLMHGWFGGAPAALVTYLPACAVFYMVVGNVDSLGKINALRTGLLFVAMFFVVMGILDFYTGPRETPFVMFQGSLDEARAALEGGMRRTRGLGLMNDPNDFAQFLVCLMPLTLLMGRGKPLVRVVIVTPILGLLLFGVYLTRSRGALVGLLIMIVLAVWDRFRWFGSLVAGGVGGAVLLVYAKVLMQRDVSLEAGADRLDIWSDALGEIKRSPLMGVGFGSFADIASLTTHNSFLLAQVELGLVGFVLWFGLFVVVLIPLWKIAAARPVSDTTDPLTNTARALRTAIIGFLATAWFLSRTYAAFPLVLLGMGAVVEHLHQQATGQVLVPRPKVWLTASVGAAVATVILAYLMVRFGRV
ncbi:O-antigen ligase family protein [Paludibaculum fermentans]|uniref:O-antigen ligase family protein n=1 Tax=Paludibaculum fermentans TaxID=1473598 RepID=UPI003EB791A6